jgi:hypothetical protein
VEISIDSFGNLLLTGYFIDFVQFGSWADDRYLSRMDPYGDRSPQSREIFVAKLSNSGVWQWAVGAGGLGNQRSLDISVDSAGNSYITGYFIDYVEFYEGSILADDTMILSSPDKINRKLFVAKLSDSGVWQWAIKGNEGHHVGKSISVDSNNDLYLTGYYQANLTFDSTKLSLTGTEYYQRSLFVVKINNQGDWQWAIKANSSIENPTNMGVYGMGIVVDSAGSAYVTGYFRGNATFDTITKISSPMDTFVGKITNLLSSDVDDDGWNYFMESHCSSNPNDGNSIPSDRDNDGYCDLLDSDNDEDGWTDEDEDRCNSNKYDRYSIPEDYDGDHICDFIDSDDDNDGWTDEEEISCFTNQLDVQSTPSDYDNDHICDLIDVDDDNDGWTNDEESSCSSLHLNSDSYPLDVDGDNICDLLDLDNDNDGRLDEYDAFPTDPAEQDDTDGDGIGNNEDSDDDGDGIEDKDDFCPIGETNWTSGAALGTDYDGDGCRDDGEDTDDDNDGIEDEDDGCPRGHTGWTSNPVNDIDGDGCHESEDYDRDGDGFGDIEDAFPDDPTEWLDSDGDGVGDNADSGGTADESNIILAIIAFLSLMAVVVIVWKMKSS